MKARWNEEETRLLARQEAELVKGGTRFINQALVEVFPERTLESIKGKRKQPAYRKLVEELLEQVSGANVGQLPPPADTDQSLDYRASILNYINDLPTPASNEINMRKLTRICESLSSWGADKTIEMLAIYLRETFPAKERGTKTSTQKKDRKLSKRQQRKVEYARVQDLWRKNRNKCLRMILDDISDV